MEVKCAMPGAQLTEMVNRRVTEMYDITDHEYRLFLQDKKQELLDSCTKVTLTPDEMALYEYRPRYFLYSKKYPPEGYWILLWLNDMRGTMDFHHTSTILVPNWKLMNGYYESYRTIKAGINRMNKTIVSSKQ